MHFGASLAVIRYNDGMNGIFKIIKELGLTPFDTLCNRTSLFDKKELNIV